MKPSSMPQSGPDLTLRDARHDMWFMEEGSTELAPAPDARIGDVVRTTFWHEDQLVLIRSSFVELTRTGKRLTVWVDMLGQSGTETTVGVRTSPRNRAGRTLIFDGRGDTPCNVVHRVNYARNVVWIRVPRGCLDAPGWLRFRQVSVFSQRNLRFAVLDDPSTTGRPSVAWTAKVRRD